MTRHDYLAWEKHVGFEGHGGAKQAAEALGVSTATIRRFRYEDASLSKTLRLAMTAIAASLDPWPLKAPASPPVWAGPGNPEREGGD
jgi:hypothetical protein